MSKKVSYDVTLYYHCVINVLFLFHYQKRHDELKSKEEPTQALLSKGQELSDKCAPEDVQQISDKLRKLKERWNDTRDRAQKRKVRTNMEDQALFI